MNEPRSSGRRPPDPEAPRRGLPEDEVIRYWQGIAQALQVSVKTAQRYEQLYGLPVRRKRGAKGTVIYALRSELNGWLANGGPPAVPEKEDDPAPSPVPRRFRWWWVCAAAAFLVAVLVLVRLRPFMPREPAVFRMEGQQVLVFNGKGALLWSHTFDFQLGAASYERRATTPVGQFVDLDGDGRKEFLFLAVSADEYQRSFYCFNGDGSIRFAVVPGITIRRTVRFGDDEFSPPFGVEGFMVADSPGREKSLLVISYDPTWFPAAVQEYSARGKLMNEYWNPGRLFALAAINTGNRRLLFVGGIANEFHSGALAVLDRDRRWGHGPATTPHYQCRNCPEGDPAAYFVFPETDVARAIHSFPTVWRIRQDAPDRISVHVLQTREPMAPGGPPGLVATTIYGFDTQLRLRSAEFVEGYGAVHSALELPGPLDHPLGPRDEAELLPVLRWNGRSFERIGLNP